MKTPREILLGRHQAVEPKLDAIRREVVADTEVGLDRRASRNLISTVAPVFFARVDPVVALACRGDERGLAGRRAFEH